MTPNEIAAYQMLRGGVSQEDAVETLAGQGLRYADAVLAVATAADADLNAANELARIRWQDNFNEQRGLTRRKLSEGAGGTLLTGPPIALVAPPPSQPSAHLLDDRQRREVHSLKTKALEAENAKLAGLPFSRSLRTGESF